MRKPTLIEVLLVTAIIFVVLFAFGIFKKPTESAPVQNVEYQTALAVNDKPDFAVNGSIGLSFAK